MNLLRNFGSLDQVTLGEPKIFLEIYINNFVIK